MSTIRLTQSQIYNADLVACEVSGRLPSSGARAVEWVRMAAKSTSPRLTLGAYASTIRGHLGLQDGESYTLEVAKKPPDEIALAAVFTDAKTDPATEAFNAIAVACGCAQWDYPGQLVRDVEALVAERDRLRALVQTVADAASCISETNAGRASHTDMHGIEGKQAERKLRAAVIACVEEAKRWEK